MQHFTTSLLELSLTIIPSWLDQLTVYINKCCTPMVVGWLQLKLPALLELDELILQFEMKVRPLSCLRDWKMSAGSKVLSWR